MRGEAKAAGRGRGSAKRAVSEPEPSVKKPPMRPAECRAYMRRTLAERFPEIVDGFVKGAKSGSCPHVKLATEFLEVRRTAQPAKTGRAVLTKWIDEMERGGR